LHEESDMTDSQPTTAAQAQLMHLLTTKWVPPVIGVLAELKIADLLADGPRSAKALAGELGAHPTALYRLLRAAVSVGVFTEDGDGRFALNPVADCLRSDVPGSLQPAAVMFSLEPFWAPYARIRHSVMTGEPAFDQMYGTSIYRYLSDHPGQARLFGAAAATFHAQAITHIADGHDFSRYGTVVDVGGGTGTLLAAILQRHPAVHGILFDRPDVVEKASETFERTGLTDRVDLVSGDFFESVPSGDALLIKSCLHNFPDDRATQILRVLRRAMSDQATLLVAETVIPAGTGPHYAKLDDVEMLVIAGGSDRDEREYAQLLAAAGFAVEQVTACGDRFTLIEARPTP
jgi:SAM-dependent methyltransferase